jgi:hypothetical protein
MRTSSFAYTFSLLSFLALCILCSCGTENVAGGSGAGNPGKTTVSIVAVPNAPCSTISAPPSLLKVALLNELPVLDTVNELYNVNKSHIIVKRIHFVVDPIDKERLASTPIDAPLRKDLESVILDGPFSFDALNGNSDPLLDSLILPDANYKGLRLVIENGPKNNSIFLSGTFVYKDTLHNFKFDLPLTLNVAYDNYGSLLHISGSDSTDFRIILDASKWMWNVNIKSCLDSQSLTFDSTGTLVIDGKFPPGTPGEEISKKIKENIV